LLAGRRFNDLWPGVRHERIAASVVTAMRRGAGSASGETQRDHQNCGAADHRPQS
jgi:hypothetical protein